MPSLTPPKRTAAGYYIALGAPVSAPALRWANGSWNHTMEWSAWASQQRAQVLDELVVNPKWFSRPPRRDILEPIFGPWDARSMQGVWGFACKTPDIPGEEGSSGSAAWLLQGVMMSSTSISPVWSLTDIALDPQQDTISLFGDGDSEEGDGETVDAGEETREIQLDDLEETPVAQPLRIRSREWEARKFLSKERVREARLKAQIAVRLARKEEARYYAQFGDLDDGESHFSDYDLTEDEISDSESDATANE